MQTTTSAPNEREKEPTPVPSPSELAAQLQLAFFRRRLNEPKSCLVWTSETGVRRG